MPFAFRPPPRHSLRGLFTPEDLATQRTFFASRPDLQPTPCLRLPALAAELGLAELLVKDETARFGLNAFKTAGTTFAVHSLRTRGEVRAGDVLTCASEGNHGRAVARAARDAGCSAQIYMGADALAARVAAIESEGAAVVRVPGGYDAAVRAMARDAEVNGWTVISDTSSAGREEIPWLIMLGYTRLMDEAAATWQPGPAPDVILVQAGVGGLLGAVASWAHCAYGVARPKIVAVEPVSAACVLESARHGKPTTLDGPFETVLAGLRCGEMSPMAFPAIQSLVDAYVAVEDAWAFEAVKVLATPAPGDPPVRAGASGAAALAGLLAILADPALSAVRDYLRLPALSGVEGPALSGAVEGPGMRALVLVSEGVTDPAGFDEAFSRPWHPLSHKRTPDARSQGTF